MPLTAPPRAIVRPIACTACGGPLHATIVGPRCPIHGVEGVR